jgi:hypothetical protein
MHRVQRTTISRILAASLMSAIVVTANSAAKAEARATGVLPAFGRVVLVVFENKAYSQVIGAPDAPMFNRLAQRYALLTNYRAVAHPSLPNYLALVSGSTQGITTDCTGCTVRAANLADTLEYAGKTWKTYAEGLPHSGFTGPWAGRYAKKHDPFLYFEDVVTRPRRLAQIVALASFAHDLAANRLPDFSLVVPDLCHDMHDCPVSTGDTWLSNFLGPLLRSAELRQGVVFVLFDEGVGNVGGGGHVAALALGPLVRPGSNSSARLDHYSLLRTIEDSWGLARLGRSRAASPISGIWR